MEVMQTNDGLTVDVVKGPVAGAAGTWLMTQMTTWMYARESEAAKKRDEAVRGGRTACERAAERASKVIDANLSDEQK